MEPLLERFRVAAAEGGMGIDLPVYEEAGRDPLDPVVLGSGSLVAPVGVFGRDPGRQEILTGEPFIGAGGQLVRKALYRARFGVDCPDLAGSVEAGRTVFWANTVPYKPVGNKAWSTAIKRRFAPIVRDLLVNHWAGHDLITLGNDALGWFALADKALKPAVDAFLKRGDRYSTTLELELGGKGFRLHPLPHPSPLNATWYKLFPELLKARLEQLGWKG